MTNPTCFEDARRDALELLELAQGLLTTAPDDCTVSQSRFTRNTISLISGARAELRKAAPLAYREVA